MQIEHDDICGSLRLLQRLAELRPPGLYPEGVEGEQEVPHACFGSLSASSC
jgi:hypothetical protein